MTDLLKMCITQGYVPPGCKLDGTMAWLLVKDGKNPCIGCNADCVHRKTPPTQNQIQWFKEQCETEKTEEQEKLERIKKREILGTNSDPIIYVDAGAHNTVIIAIVPNAEKGYVKRCKESIEEVVAYIEIMSKKHNAKQVIIPLNGYGIAIYRLLVDRNLKWLDIVPIWCMSDRFM